MDWACSGFNIFLQTSTLIYLEGVDPSDPVISKPHNGKPPSYFVRLWRGMTYCINFRGIKTPYQVKNVPAFDGKRPGWVPSKTRFMLRQLTWFIVLYVFYDFLFSQEMGPEDEAKFMGVNRENLIIRDPADGPITGDELGYRIFMVGLMWTAMIPFAVSLQYIGFSLIGVGFGLSEPENWPPVYGHAKDSYTLRLFWGKFWHQTLRWHFSKPASFITHQVLRLPKEGLVQRYVNIFFVFFISGCMHANQSYMLGMGQIGAVRELIFFCAMPVGIMVEDGIQWLFRSQKVRKGEEEEGFVWWKRAIGYVWVWGLLVWLAPLIDYPKLRMRMPTWLPVHVLGVLEGKSLY
ncbi:hypothetical protein ABW19_dt0206861 [Dactylella cylindrospora]|nr:hypothetical protein ABW19_dt0206861 [Dactylella cylindrospora]